MKRAAGTRRLERRVCAPHGRELMGWKSPVGVPAWTHRVAKVPTVNAALVHQQFAHLPGEICARRRCDVEVAEFSRGRGSFQVLHESGLGEGPNMRSRAKRWAARFSMTKPDRASRDRRRPMPPALCAFLCVAREGAYETLHEPPLRTRTVGGVGAPVSRRCQCLPDWRSARIN